MVAMLICRFTGAIFEKSWKHRRQVHACLASYQLDELALECLATAKFTACQQKKMMIALKVIDSGVKPLIAAAELIRRVTMSRGFDIP
ncbi:hypothetical protein B5K05_01350 [Rhizobium phaseoli]|nr:hypothetical protein B5K04_01345 [Rhizobium phaseoli]RDJ19457.1 hypothetical protein B5K05_01350 [Rhizobium phaseoli]